jgi:crossover junction endodeoxyribonuclease RusA
MEPRTVNHYVKHSRSGRHYKTKLATAFEDFGALFVKGQYLQAKAYHVRIEIYLGKGSKGDLDNFAKQPLDLLTKCGVISSDAKVTELYMEKHRDAKNPRTEIYVRPA